MGVTYENLPALNSSEAPLVNITNASGNASGELEDNMYALYARRASVYAMPVLLLLGTIGNVLTILVYRLRRRYSGSFRKRVPTDTNVKDLQTRLKFYLIVLSSANLTVLYVRVPAEWFGILLERNELYVRDSSDIACKISAFLECTCSEFAIWMICVLSLDRVMGLMFPFQANSVNLRKIKRALFGLFLFFCAINAHALVTYGVNQRGECTLKVPFSIYQAWVIVTYSLYAFLPFLVIVVTNSIIVYIVRKARKSAKTLCVGQTRGQSDSHETAKKLIPVEMLIVLSNLFIFTYMPLYIYLVCVFFMAKQNLPVNEDVYYVVYHIGKLYTLLNHASHFVVFGLTGKQFRDDLYSLFRKSVRRTGRGPRAAEDSHLVLTIEGTNRSSNMLSKFRSSSVRATSGRGRLNAASHSRGGVIDNGVVFGGSIRRCDTN